ncbi:MAG: orotidine-5'-phosphate decarboxylase [Bifidobacteriaceae bacterium]|jgi:orotidine-5'-phosphate decarboxylase|nr:orotidine-5'-phosphate decarboxylase [Bifidobacteriaceae bacterium]
MSGFGQRLARAMAQRGRLCVGIDPHPASLAAWGLEDTPASLERFALSLVEAAAAGGAAAVKPQSACFERHGARGLAALERALAAARAARVLTILDVKRGDIGSTMADYARAYLDDAAPLAADAITLSPYLGFGSLEPALELAAETGRGVFVLAFTSNPEGQSVQHAVTPGGLSVGESMIQAAASWNADWAAAAGAETAGHSGLVGLVGLVIGATIGSLPPRGAQLIAQVGGHILAPGVGAQGAGPTELRTVFGPALSLVLPTASRSVAAAGPDPERLVQKVAEAVQAMSFLGN